MLTVSYIPSISGWLAAIAIQLDMVIVDVVTTTVTVIIVAATIIVVVTATTVSTTITIVVVVVTAIAVAIAIAVVITMTLVVSIIWFPTSLVFNPIFAICADVDNTAPGGGCLRSYRVLHGWPERSPRWFWPWFVGRALLGIFGGFIATSFGLSSCPCSCCPSASNSGSHSCRSVDELR